MAIILLQLLLKLSFFNHLTASGFFCNASLLKMLALRRSGLVDLPESTISLRWTKVFRC